jgi:hypothetical protein
LASRLKDQEMFITWDDVGRIETPGWVTVRGRDFEVKQEHIDAWKQDPDGAWTLVGIDTDEGTSVGSQHVRPVFVNGHFPRAACPSPTETYLFGFNSEGHANG